MWTKYSQTVVKQTRSSADSMGTIIHSEYIHKHSKAKDIVRSSYYSAGLSKHDIVSVVVPIDAA